MKVALAARLLYDEWKSRPATVLFSGGTEVLCRPQEAYLSFLKTQAVDSTAKGHAAYKLVVKWIRDGKFIRD